MLFVNHATDTKAAKDYFTEHLSRSDYYMRDAQEVAGEWHGRGAELLGLSGTVDQENYFRLCENINPETGEQLTPRLKADRRILYDFTFDAPKSVTLAYELGGDERIEKVFREAVKETMTEMEVSMQARVRTKGADEDRQTSNMVWAEFIHRTTRPVDGIPDPQLHCHAVAFNATFDPVEERWKAGQFGNLVRDRGYYQAAFHSRFAEKLAALGYGIERDGKSFKLVGIDEASCKPFSRRTAIIEAVAERLNITDPAVKRELGRRTREGKPAEQMTMSELREQEWTGRLSEAELKAIVDARHGNATLTPGAAQAMDYAISHCFTNQSVLPEKKLITEALIHGVGNTRVHEAWSQANRDGIIRREKDGQRYATTQDVWREELAMVDYVRDGRGKHRKLGGSAIHTLDSGLSDEQRKAALVILNSRDTVTELRGGAGTGKTTMMKATVHAIEEGGLKVFAFAPSANASRIVLREAGFDSADTVEKLLTTDAIREQVHGQVLWIDEAGLLSSRDMKRVLDFTRQENCRVVLGGDVKQHSAVERGDALRLLEQEAGMKFAELKQVYRQKSADYRAAVTALSEGNARQADGRTGLQAGIEQLVGMGAVVELEGQDRYRPIAADYISATSERRPDGSFKSAIVVSPTHAEGRRVTEEIRQELKSAGRLGASERQFLSLKPLHFTEAQRGDAGNFRVGEIIKFHQNAKGFTRGERVTVTRADAQGVEVARPDGSACPLPLTEAKKFQVYGRDSIALAAGDRLRVTMNGYTREVKRGAKMAKSRLNNGASYEVAGFTPQGDIKLGNGFVVPKDYGGLAYNYVVTSHASQGATVDKVLVALGSESLVAANRQQFYVSVSRGRESVKLYTDDKDAMLSSVKKEAARISATELLKDAKPSTPPARSTARRLTAIQHVQRIYRAARERVSDIGARIKNRQEVHFG